MNEYLLKGSARGLVGCKDIGAGKAPVVGIEGRIRCREASLQPTSLLNSMNMADL